MRRSTGLLFFSCVLLVGLFSLSARPVRADSIITICTQGNLQASLNFGGLITINCGPNPVTIDLTSTLTVPVANTTIEGGGLVTLRGNGSVRLLHNTTTLTLRNLTLANAFGSTFGGGALYNTATAKLTLENVTFRDNTADPTIWGGGAIYNAGTVIAHNTTFSNSWSAGGGAIYNDVGAKATLDQNSRVIGNRVTGSFGGGITNAGTLTLTDILIDSNIVTSTAATAPGGGGIMNYSSGTVFLNNGIVSNNIVTGTVPLKLGGGILNYGRLDVHGGSISGNRATGGGGIFQDSVYDLSLIGTTVIYNVASGGGGVRLAENNRGQIVNSTIGFNSADSGGGIQLVGSNLVVIEGSTLKNNSALLYGGGIASDAGMADIRSANSTYADNSAAQGGAVYAQYSSILSENDTYSGNSASSHAGGIFHGGTRTVTLRNDTLSGNYAPTGGGLYAGSSTDTIIANTVIANSPTGGNCAGPSITAKYSLSSDNTCVLVGTGNSVNPNVKLSSLGNYGGPTLVHMPLLDSPLIDGVSGSDAPQFDQRGQPRPVGAGYDIGSVERQVNDRDWPWAAFLPLLLR